MFNSSKVCVAYSSIGVYVESIPCFIGIHDDSILLIDMHDEATVASFRKAPVSAATYLDAVLLDGDQEELMLAHHRFDSLTNPFNS